MTRKAINARWLIKIIFVVFPCKRFFSLYPYQYDAASLKHTFYLTVFREEFRSTPSSQSIISGETLMLNCTPPRGYPEPKIVWKKDGHSMNLLDSRMKMLPSGDLQIENVKSNDQGIYSCLAENMVGFRESPPASIKVLGEYFYTFFNKYR